jgi:hypothetical protein
VNQQASTEQQTRTRLINQDLARAGWSASRRTLIEEFVLAVYMLTFAKAWPDSEMVQQPVGPLPWGHNLTAELQTSLPSIEQIERESGDLP